MNDCRIIYDTVFVMLFYIFLFRAFINETPPPNCEIWELKVNFPCALFLTTVHCRKISEINNLVNNFNLDNNKK